VKHFFDCEFNEDGQTIDLISIGIAAEDGREYYACNQEAQLHRVNDWVRANVLPKLPPYDGHLAANPKTVMSRLWKSRKEIAQDVVLFTGGPSTPLNHNPYGLHWEQRDIVYKSTWLPTHEDSTPIEFWAYFADYDWVALCQLYGTMMQLPPSFPMFCQDLKQLSVDVGGPTHPPDPKDEHNALADARWNRDLYTFLMNHRAGEQAIAVMKR
jgi:hypothetical protein